VRPNVVNLTAAYRDYLNRGHGFGRRDLAIGDLVNFNPHIHALVADGVFRPSGTFRVLPSLTAPALAEILLDKVLPCCARKAASTRGCQKHKTRNTRT